MKIFLHKEGQLRAAHIILGYKLSTKRFQSLKNVIRARDLHLALIDIVVLSFLLSEPPPEGTQYAELPTPLATRLLYSQETPIPSDDEAKESTPEPIHLEVTEKVFEFFYYEDDSNTAIARSSTEMGIVEKSPDLLALLIAYAGGSSPAVAVTPRPLTLAVSRTSPANAAEKKRKKGQGGKGAEDAEEGEIIEPLAKEARAGKG